MDGASMQQRFLGWRVVGAAFVLAIFGWGLGFYGPPIFLHEVRQTRGWSLASISAAVTAHFVLGAVAVANLPRLYRRFGLPTITKAGAVSLSVGLLGWSLAQEPWQLFAASLFSGIGWVALIAALGFPLAAACVGVATIAIVWLLCDVYFSRQPTELGQSPDGLTVAAPIPTSAGQAVPPLGAGLWRHWRFSTLAVAMALGLFAQIGLIAHLFTLVLPVLGEIGVGLAMTMATAAAILGRTSFGWLMPAGMDRRLVACLSYAIQLAGSLVLLMAGEHGMGLVLLGIFLFGFGIGNATSLPPLIAQAEFAPEDTARVVPAIVAIGQGAYAFARLFRPAARTGAGWRCRRVHRRCRDSTRRHRLPACRTPLALSTPRSKP